MAMRCHPVFAFAVHPAALGYILLPHSLQPDPVAPIFYVIPSSGEGVAPLFVPAFSVRRLFRWGKLNK